MSLRAIVYAYILGGFTFIPLVIVAAIAFSIYTSVPVGDPDPAKRERASLEKQDVEEHNAEEKGDLDDAPRTKKGWLTVRRTFEESSTDGSYVTMVRSFIDARSKDPKKSRPKDMWYVVLKGKVLFLYEDEDMSDCEGAIELGGHDVVVYPEDLLDGELFAKRNAICLKPKVPPKDKAMPSVTKEMQLETVDVDKVVEESGGSPKSRVKEKNALLDVQAKQERAREEATNINSPWFIFVRSNIEMEDWYLALVHASDHKAHMPMLRPLKDVFEPEDMNHLVTTLDEQADVIPMRWLNALLGRIFFSYYKTHALEANIIARLMKKLSKVKRPNFLTDIVVTEVSLGNKVPSLSKPMLKELTKEGDAALEVHLSYKGEIRITIQATATINLGARFKSYTVKLVLAAVLKELEGNLLIKVKRPPSNRIWYAFTQMPRMVLSVEPVVSDRQITWGMILSTIESRVKEIILESVVLPNMDDIAFFESSGYQHRGGIWSDASRSQAEPLGPSMMAPQSESISATSSTTDEPNPAIITDMPAVKPAKSFDDLKVHSAPPSVLPESSPETISLLPNSSENGTSEFNTTKERRKTWFSSVRSDALGSQPPRGEEAEDNEVERGRPLQADTSTASRSLSTPSKVENILDETVADNNDSTESFLSPAASQPRRIREHAKSVSTDSTDSIHSSSPTSRDIPSSSSLTSPTSFLSTLKSRAAAADKQALSASAKEAMRKWGVNWGAKKDSVDSARSVESDEPMDDGLLNGRSRVQSTGNGAMNKPRSSYAEVRAAVAERRDRMVHGEEGHPELTRTTSPISISKRSEGPKERARTGSISVSRSRDGDVASSMGGNSRSVSSSSSFPRSLEDESNKPVAVPTMARVDSHTSQAVDSDGVSSPSKIPIHIQPRAKVMSIPGIHQSHRGDVQSMGNIAPPAPVENKSKNPSIQSVYRLWKGPLAAGSQPSVEGTASTETTPNPDTADNSNPSASASQHRPTPPNQTAAGPISRPGPPLPPRSLPTSVSSIPVTPRKVNVESSPRTSPSASEALKHIANKHTNSRPPSLVLDGDHGYDGTDDGGNKLG